MARVKLLTGSNYKPMEEKYDIDRWGIVKNWFEDNQSDIVLIIGVILIVLIGFGLGRLTAPKSTGKPVVITTGIMNYESGIKDGEASVLNNAALKDSLTAGSVPQKNNNVDSSKGIIVASRNGTKYYWSWSSGAQKIKPENLVWFKSETEAKAAGLAPCSTFAKDAPAGYAP
jgi:hypothetical protein